ncbi:MAG: hypothetical protein MJ181_01805 [Treponema sp.]|nr:hypothetical protein [Treponema sp.]
MNVLKELTEEKKSKQINLKVLLDVLKLKKYEISFMQCDNESEITLFFIVPKEDIILIPGLKQFQDFYSDIIKKQYERKEIKNNFPLKDYLDFNLSLLFNYSPLAIEENDAPWEDHENHIRVLLKYTDPENDELDHEFDHLKDGICEKYDKEITVKFDSYSSTDYFLERNENYEKKEFFEKLMNKLFFYEYKMTIYEYLLESEYKVNIEEIDEKIKNHLQRIHRQVLFDAYEEIILEKNKKI